MSASETTATYEPRHFLHRRTEVDAIFYDGTEHCRNAIAAWVRDGGGQVEIRSDGGLLVLGARKWMTVRPGLDHVVRSIDVPGRGREYFPMGDDIMTEAYEPANGTDHSATLTRDQSAAIVVAADQLQDRAGRHPTDVQTLHAIIGELVGHVHALGASQETMR